MEGSMRFQDKVAIVTGGASGIGKEVATRFAAEGGSVVINGRDLAKAEAAAREIDATGKRVAVHAGDISLPASSHRSRFSSSARRSTTASSISFSRENSSRRRRQRRP